MWQSGWFSQIRSHIVNKVHELIVLFVNLKIFMSLFWTFGLSVNLKIYDEYIYEQIIFFSYDRACGNTVTWCNYFYGGGVMKLSVPTFFRYIFSLDGWYLECHSPWLIVSFCECTSLRYLDLLLDGLRICKQRVASVLIDVCKSKSGTVYVYTTDLFGLNNCVMSQRLTEGSVHSASARHEDRDEDCADHSEGLPMPKESQYLKISINQQKLQ